MSKIVPALPRFTPDRELFDRALSHYLQPASPPSFSVHHDLSFEDALAQICDLLRCAAATEHLIDNAKTLADRALDCLQAH